MPITTTEAPSTVEQDNGPEGDTLTLRLMTALGLDRARELQLTDEADEARWVDAQLDALAEQAGPPPF